jgi:hypothetical protein
LIYLINNVENFFIDQNIDNEDADVSLSEKKKFNPATGQTANEIFDFELYLQHKLVKENKDFFEKFLRSQLFINFIERAYHEE